MASFGLLGSLAVSTPSYAADMTGLPLATASTMLAAVTAPMLAIDEQALAAEDDFSNDAPTTAPQTLAALVEAQETADTTDAEQHCLAASVYYESKGEPLKGQLAVAETIVNRAASGRFPDTICGVVRQAGQFSFVRGGQVPTPPQGSAAWATAVAIARIAQAGLWQDIAPKALYFHASRVSPRWGGAKRIAQLGNHVFYR